MNNFHFLKIIDKNLYEIISEAERLYKDEYFEQCITQTRRFAENVCKKVLDNSITTERTFDDMLATLKDKTTHSEQEKEFIDDLYFIKREGNNSTHATCVKQDGMVALECLQRAFEVAINYSVYYKKWNKNLLKLQYDIDLLVTGKRKKRSLKEKYEEEREKSNLKNQKTSKSKTSTKKAKVSKPQNCQYKEFSLFKLFVKISTFISAVLVLTIFLLSKIN